jgi:hypothetical protein
MRRGNGLLPGGLSLVLVVGACGAEVPASSPTPSPSSVVTPSPGAADHRADGYVFLGGLEIDVAPTAAASPAVEEGVAVAVVVDGLSAGKARVIGTHRDSPALTPAATEFVPGLVRILGPAGGTDYEAPSPLDAWVVVAEGQGSDGLYSAVGVVGQDGSLLTLYVLTPGVG